jgi:hypothetical protein
LTALFISVPWRKSSRSPNEANCVEVTIVMCEARLSHDRCVDPLDEGALQPS